MKKCRFSEEKMVKTLREADKTPMVHGSNVRRQNNLDTRLLLLRDSFQSQSRPLLRRRTPSFFVASFSV
jgi:hypothetical protein